jgi:hypothetical protein
VKTPWGGIEKTVTAAGLIELAHKAARPGQETSGGRGVSCSRARSGARPSRRCPHAARRLFIFQATTIESPPVVATLSAFSSCSAIRLHRPTPLRSGTVRPGGPRRPQRCGTGAFAATGRSAERRVQTLARP